MNKHWTNLLHLLLAMQDQSKSFNNSIYSLSYAKAYWRNPSPRHCSRATQFLSKKCCSSDEPLATLCSILPVRDLNLRPPAPETHALPIDQLAGPWCQNKHAITLNVVTVNISQCYEQIEKRSWKLT